MKPRASTSGYLYPEVILAQQLRAGLVLSCESEKAKYPGFSGKKSVFQQTFLE